MFKTKYRAKKTDGFDSKKERNRYIQLLLLQKSGVIKDLKKQVSFELQGKFVYNGKTERAISYIADFVYNKDGKKIVEDVKGFRTDVYKIKRKLFLNKFGKKYLFIET